VNPEFGGLPRTRNVGLAHLLLDDLRRVLKRLQRQAGPGRGPEAASFAHGAGRPEGDDGRDSARRTPSR